MSGDFVRKAEAINKIMGCIVNQDCHDVNLHNIGLRKAMSAIDGIPAADVVEVVRCADCRYAYDTVCGWCCSHGICVDCTVREDFFCADGKCKDGGPDDGKIL